jgi:hypothetical protein
MNWQPIETAPKDGTAIIAFIPGTYNKVDIVAFGSDGNSGEAWCHARCVDGLNAGNPSHWMPLPEPPKEVK